MKQELREQQADCKCTIPTPSSTYLQPTPSPSTPDLSTSTPPSTDDLSTSNSPSTADHPTSTSPSTTNLSVTIPPSVSPTTSPSSTPGPSEDRPAQSCHHVYQKDSSSPSGYYWINTTEGPTEAYCVMNPPDCNITGGWMRVVLHNMTDPRTTTCPGDTIGHTPNGKRLCAVSSHDHCDPVVFPVHGIPYNHVCGRALGYSYYIPCAFREHTRPLSQNYLTGLSITQGPFDEHGSHIWSYAAGLREEILSNCNCPCARHPGQSPPSYVTADYYCDTATVHYPTA